MKTKNETDALEDLDAYSFEMEKEDPEEEEEIVLMLEGFDVETPEEQIEEFFKHLHASAFLNSELELHNTGAENKEN